MFVLQIPHGGWVLELKKLFSKGFRYKMDITTVASEIFLRRNMRKIMKFAAGIVLRRIDI